jgi:membrane protein involved in colicin uptake
MGNLIKMVHVLETWFESGVEKFKAGTHHPLTGETQHLVNIGTAKIIQVDPDLDKAQKARLKADAALANAKQKAEEARIAQEAAEQLDADAKALQSAETAVAAEAQAKAKADAEQKAKEDADAAAEAQAKAQADAEALAKDAAGNTGDLLGGDA